MLIMNWLFWNVRGLGKGEKCISIRKLVEKHKLSVLAMVETKHRHSFARRVRRIWGRDEYEWCESLASDTSSGGIIAIWDPENFSVSQRFTNERWIILEGCLKEVSFNCCVGIVYGPNDREGRRLMYESLKQLVQSINKPLVLLGDFNEVLHPSERLGQFRYDSSMRDFLEWIQDLNLIDVPLHGVKFTWGRNESQSRLDRCLCVDEWFTNFPEMRLEGLKRGASDHNPILLSFDKVTN